MFAARNQIMVPKVLPSFDTLGTATGYYGATHSPTWTHDIAGNALFVVATGTVTTGSFGACTAGGVTMTKLASVTKINSGGFICQLVLYSLLKPPVGIGVSLGITTSTTVLGVQSFSYFDVGTLGTVSSNATGSLTVSSAPNQTVLEICSADGFGGGNAAISLSAGMPNQRCYLGAHNSTFLAGEAPGASSVTFTFTASGGTTSTPKGAMALPLIAV